MRPFEWLPYWVAFVLLVIGYIFSVMLMVGLKKSPKAPNLKWAFYLLCTPFGSYAVLLVAAVVLLNEGAANLYHHVRETWQAVNGLNKADE